MSWAKAGFSRMSKRPAQTNCQQEPPYPDHATVVFTIREPEWTAHAASSRCAIEEPHRIDDCGEFHGDKNPILTC